MLHSPSSPSGPAKLTTGRLTGILTGIMTGMDRGMDSPRHDARLPGPGQERRGIQFDSTLLIVLVLVFNLTFSMVALKEAAYEIVSALTFAGKLRSAFSLPCASKPFTHLVSSSLAIICTLQPCQPCEKEHLIRSEAMP